MPIVDKEKDYISWSDVHTLTRYLEAGYGGRFKFVMVIGAPIGEQHLKQYWELHWCDNALETRPVRQRLLASFPTPSAKSLPAALVGLLYQADNILSQEAVWTDPKVAVKPRLTTT